MPTTYDADTRIKPRTVTGSPPFPSYYGFPRMGGSMTRVTLRCDVSWIEREPSRGGYERNHLSMFSAICFLSYEATIYDAGHHNFEFPPTLPQR